MPLLPRQEAQANVALREGRGGPPPLAASHGHILPVQLRIVQQGVNLLPRQEAQVQHPPQQGLRGNVEIPGYRNQIGVGQSAALPRAQPELMCW